MTKLLKNILILKIYQRKKNDSNKKNEEQV